MDRTLIASATILDGSGAVPLLEELEVSVATMGQMRGRTRGRRRSEGALTP